MVEIRHRFVLGDTDCDNHTKNDECWYCILSTVDLRAGPKKSKNIIFSPWGRENIQNDAAQPIQTPEHSECIFQIK